MYSVATHSTAESSRPIIMIMIGSCKVTYIIEDIFQLSYYIFCKLLFLDQRDCKIPDRQLLCTCIRPVHSTFHLAKGKTLLL